jgi:Ca-activated chloride channel family protein
MLAKDVAPTRLVAAREAALAFVDRVPRDVRVGAITFNQNPTVLQSPTRDHEIVASALRTVTAAGSTATGDALQAALSLIRATREQARSQTPAAVVLLSDGESVRGRDVLTVAATARQVKVPVYTVALGTQAGTIVSRTGKVQHVPPDVATLRQVAERTGGKAYAIADAEKLTEVYAELGSQLATEKQPKEMTSWVAGAALVLLLAGVGTSARLFGRPL